MYDVRGNLFLDVRGNLFLDVQKVAILIIREEMGVIYWGTDQDPIPKGIEFVRKCCHVVLGFVSFAKEYGTTVF